MTIYNRWGEIVFESNDLGKGWNGTMNEKASIEDVYVYKINFRDIFNTERTITGRVSLIR
jgi:gliding motility-associated-like protein